MWHGYEEIMRRGLGYRDQEKEEPAAGRTCGRGELNVGHACKRLRQDDAGVPGGTQWNCWFTPPVP
jgi:hypothetical protein